MDSENGVQENKCQKDGLKKQDFCGKICRENDLSGKWT